MKAMFWKFVSLVSTCILFYPLLQHELQRWNDAYVMCVQRFQDNTHVLQQPVCRLASIDKVRDMCRQAQEENQASPTRCAWRTFWLEGELYKLYTQVAHSQWMIAAITVPSLLMVIYMWMQSRTENERIKQQMQFFSMFQQQAPTKALTPPRWSPPPREVETITLDVAPIREKRRKRRHRTERYDYVF